MNVNNKTLEFNKFFGFLSKNQLMDNNFPEREKEIIEKELKEFLRKFSNFSGSVTKKKEFLLLHNEYKDNLIKANIQSFSNKDDPLKIRIRSDVFLRKAIKNKYCFLLFHCWTPEGVKFFAISGKQIYQNKDKSPNGLKVNQSDSFITIKFNVFFEKWMNRETTLIKTKMKRKMPIEIYSWNEGELSFEDFNNWLFKNELNDSVFENSNDELNNIYIPLINENIKSLVEKRYNYSCAFYDKDLKCKTSINWKETLENLKSDNLMPQIRPPYEFHHILPQKNVKQIYFKDITDENDTFQVIVDRRVIHSPNNIILLCKICHDEVHMSENSFNLLKYKKKKIEYMLEISSYFFDLNGHFEKFLGHRDNSQLKKFIKEIYFKE